MKVQKIIAEYTAKLELAIREEALAKVTESLGGAYPATRSEKAPPVRAEVGKAVPTKRAKKGQKRSPDELQRTMERVREALRKADDKGLSAEELKKLGIKDFSLPILKLLAAKSIKKTGNKRSTRYFIA